MLLLRQMVGLFFCVVRLNELGMKAGEEKVQQEPEGARISAADDVHGTKEG